MDVKGITWFGNVYQKFETMCLEVEEAVCQDTVKYVDNQVHTVGASVKKFYSEVVDELLSPSLADPVKVNSLSCTGVHKKPKLGIKEEPKKQMFEDRNVNTKVDKNYSAHAPSLDRFSNIDPAVPCNPVNSSNLLNSNITTAVKCMGSASKKSNLVIKRKPKSAIPNSFEKPTTNPAATNPSKETVPFGAFTSENNKAQTDQIPVQQLDCGAISCSWAFEETGGNKPGNGSQENFKLKKIADALEKPANIVLSEGNLVCHPNESVLERNFEKEETSKPVHFTKTSDDVANIPPLEASSGPNVPYADLVIRSKNAHDFSYSYAAESTEQTGESDSWNVETITSDDVAEESPEIVYTNFNNHFTLEESCIIVDRDNLLPLDPLKDPKHKSYKKKLRDAFSSSGKSIRKKEYRQLAAQYESTTNAEHEQRSASSILNMTSSDSGAKKLKSIELCESEWEIL